MTSYHVLKHSSWRANLFVSILLSLWILSYRLPFDFQSSNEKARSDLNLGVWRSWLRGCRFIYLDIGTNTGIQIRKLFEPSLYPEAPVLEFFDRWFGKNRSSMSNLCAIGMEPNVVHKEYLKRLETTYQMRGWRTKIFTEMAASLQYGTTKFYMDEGQTKAVGASLYHREHINHSKNFTVVQTVDFSHFLKYILEGRDIDGYVLMKLDIEGFEHTLIPNLILSGAICEVDEVLTEIHTFGREFPEVQSYNATDFINFFQYFAHVSKDKCSTRFTDFDDETYYDSQFPLP